MTGLKNLPRCDVYCTDSKHGYFPSAYSEGPPLTWWAFVAEWLNGIHYPFIEAYRLQVQRYRTMCGSRVPPSKFRCDKSLFCTPLPPGQQSIERGSYPVTARTHREGSEDPGQVKTGAHLKGGITGKLVSSEARNLLEHKIRKEKIILRIVAGPTVRSSGLW